MSDTPLPAAPADQAPKPFPVRMAEAKARKASGEITPKRTYNKTGRFSKKAKGSAPSKPNRKVLKVFFDALKYKHVSVNSQSLETPALRVPTKIRDIADMVEYHDQEAFWDGQFSALGEIWPTWSRITQHGEELKKFLEAHRDRWKVASNQGAQRILEQLPDVLTVFRGCAARNRLGFTWCSTEAAARAYPLSPPFREKEPLLITAAIDKANVVSLRETHHGFECLALAEPADIVGEVKL